ncbi:MAG TPA: alpha/beta hydrolase [Pseudomonadales bacterium]|nr:alpha/beta hydrolase [Pseudomonadales bacterium]
MKDAAEARTTDTIDPDIRRFTSIVMADYQRLSGGRTLPVAEMRRIAEEVREPWRRGGPVMHARAEHHVPTPAGSVRIRVYDPAPRGPKPVLVYLHGGGWTLFSLDTHDRVMREYAARAGVVVVGVDYSLAPEARYPVALTQVVGVIRWLRANGAVLGIDCDRIAVGGDSAGGNLTTAAALLMRDAGEGDAIGGMLLIYPALDRDCSEESLRLYGGAGAMLTGEEVAWFWDNYGGEADLCQDPLASPLRARFEGLPPACLTLAQCDVLAEQGLRMAERLRATAVPVEATVYPGATHSFIEAVAIAPLAEQAVADGARWLRKTLA